MELIARHGVLQHWTLVSKVINRCGMKRTRRVASKADSLETDAVHVRNVRVGGGSDGNDEVV